MTRIHSFTSRLEKEAYEASQEATATSNGKIENPWIALVEDGADIVVKQLPPLVEIVEGIIAEHSKLLIGSGSKSWKTWLTLDMALSIAHQRSFLGRATIRRRVLYMNLELKPETFARRVQTICQAKSILMDRGWFRHLPLRGEIGKIHAFEIIDRFITLATDFGIGVLVIDPLYKINTVGDENGSRDQTLLFNQLDRLTTQAGCTLIINDHFGKGNQSEKDPLDSIRGSSAKGGDIDAGMILRRHEEPDCFRVDLIHRELPPIDPFCIGWHYPLMEVRGDLDPGNMKKAGGKTRQYDAKQLLTYIAERTIDNPIRISEWAEVAGIPRTTLADYLPEMRGKDWITTIGDGRSARQAITAKGRSIIGI